MKERGRSTARLPPSDTLTIRFACFLQFYHFTLFAMTLNELDTNRQAHLPPTDSRLRPDVRLMEDGNIGIDLEDFGRREFHSAGVLACQSAIASLQMRPPARSTDSRRSSVTLATRSRRSSRTFRNRPRTYISYFTRAATPSSPPPTFPPPIPPFSLLPIKSYLRNERWALF